MLGTPSDINTDSLSGFQFTAIGKPPSLLGRITSKVDDGQEAVASPPSSPLASPKMTLSPGIPSTSRSSWFVNVLSTQPEEETLNAASQTGQSATRTSDASGSTTSHHGLPARPSPTVIGEAQRQKPSKAATAKRTSRPSPSLPVQTSSSSSALHPASSATPDRSPALPTHSGVALARPPHVAPMSPASIDKPLPQDDHEADMDESLRQTIVRFESEVAEIARLQVETRRLGADFQDKSAHLHARAEGLAEQFRSRHANTERRVARASQRADELETRLHDAHNTITRLEGGNGHLRGELDRLRAELDQLRGERDRLRGERDRQRGEVDRLRGELDVVHGELDQVRRELERVRIQAEKDDILVNEALKSSQEAIRETELARARWAVVQKKLEDQLGAQKRDAAADKEAQLTQIEELKRAVEDARRRAAVLVEEKLKLEVQNQTEVARRKHLDGSQKPGHQQSDQRSSVAGATTAEGNEQVHRKPTTSHQPQTDRHVPRVSSLPGSISSPSSILSTISPSQISHVPPSAYPTTDGDGATQQRPRGKALHLGDDGLSHPTMSPPNEPLLAVKGEDESEVKAKVEPVEDASSALSYAPHHSLAVRKPRREQSLDYAPMQQAHQSPPMHQFLLDSAALSGFPPPHNKEQSPGSPVVSLGRHSPELTYPSRRSSYEPTSSLREPSPTPFAQVSSAPPPAIVHPQPHGGLSPQPTGERRGPVTPPLENAPSVQAKRLIRRPGRQQQALSPCQAVDSAALPARPTQPLAQRSSSPPVRRVSDSWRPPHNHEPRPQIRYSDQSRDRHKRRRDDDADTRPPAARRPRLTPPPRGDHYAPSHDVYPPPANRSIPQDFERKTPPRESSNDRSHYQPPAPQEYQNYDAPPFDDERTYVPALNGNARRRANHYSPPQDRYSPDVSTTGYAPGREARAAPLPADTEPPHPQMAPSLAQRLQGNPDAPVCEQLVATSAPNKPVSEPRLPRTSGPAPRARRQAKRPASRSPSPKRSPPATLSQEPFLNVSGPVSLLERFSDSKAETHAPASRGRGSGRGRGNRGRGGQPQQRQPAERPQKSLEERLSTNRNPNPNHEGGGGLMDRIQPR